MNSTRPTTQLDAVIIGAGIAGLYQLHRLREQGLRVKAFEAGDDVGGTWCWNRYPGARFDSSRYIYQYWFSEELNKEWSWSEKFPGPARDRALAELRGRPARSAQGHPVQYARSPPPATTKGRKRWSLVHTDQGDAVDAQFFISCAGMLSAPLHGAFAGQDEFSGQRSSTPRAGPPGPSICTGKRVGVVGIGATGIQVIQTIASRGRPPHGLRAHPAVRDADEEPEATDRRNGRPTGSDSTSCKPPRDAHVRRLRVRLRARRGPTVARGATSEILEEI